jgi:hypothetical protein
MRIRKRTMVAVLAVAGGATLAVWLISKMAKKASSPNTGITTSRPLGLPTAINNPFSRPVAVDSFGNLNTYIAGRG